MTNSLPTRRRYARRYALGMTAVLLIVFLPPVGLGFLAAWAAVAYKNREQRAVDPRIRALQDYQRRMPQGERRPARDRGQARA